MFAKDPAVAVEDVEEDEELFTIAPSSILYAFFDLIFTPLILKMSPETPLGRVDSLEIP